ncbi:MAG: cytochrome P450 [Actinobacteria bacterium]|nr:cytochrome P450 [Actinomycetota bacterium]
MNVSFGFGPHACIGGHIAEIETRVLFAELLPKLNDWRLSEPAEIHWDKVGEYRFPARIERLPISVLGA